MRTYLLLSLCATVLCLSGGCGGSQSAHVPAAIPEMQKVAPAAIPIQPAAPPPPAQPIQVAAASPQMTVVKAWDFAELDPANWEWSFRAAQKHKRPTGAMWGFEGQETPFPNLYPCSLEAKDIAYIRIVCDVRSGSERGPTVPLATVRLFWACENDEGVIPGDFWSGLSHKKFVDLKPEPGSQNAFIVKLKDNEKWTGKIVKCHFKISLNDPEAPKDQTYCGVIKSIEFLR